MNDYELNFLSVNPPNIPIVEFLYGLLIERPKNANISHKKMPSLAEHYMFILSHPYKKWSIICIDFPGVGLKKVGAIYLTNLNEIGIAIKKEFQGMGIAKKAITQYMKQNGPGIYHANISPKNEKSINLFKGLGFDLCQYTYRKEV